MGWSIFAWEIENRYWRIVWFIVGIAATTVSFTMALEYMYSGAITPIEELRDVCEYYKQAMGQDYECTCQRQRERWLVEKLVFGEGW